MEIMVLGKPLSQPLEPMAPMQELCHDWHGQPMDPPARFRLVEDPTHLWLIAGRAKPAKSHPAGNFGAFCEGLWHEDVAELFIAQADGQRYLEFNLSPAGAWWAAAFSAPRVPCSTFDALPAVRVESRIEDGGGWRAALGIPLDWLQAAIGWGKGSRANVTFILDSPDQRFLSVCDLGGGEPDFHRPHGFSRAQEAEEWGLIRLCTAKGVPPPVPEDG
jgi:hypothetical protein